MYSTFYSLKHLFLDSLKLFSGRVFSKVREFKVCIFDIQGTDALSRDSLHSDASKLSVQYFRHLSAIVYAEDPKGFGEE